MLRLGGDTYARLVRSEADEDALQRWLASLHPEVRTAFVAALIVLDGSADLGQVIDGWPRLRYRLVTPDRVNGAVDEQTVMVVPRLCEYCDQPLPPWEQPATGGRPPIYHEQCRLAAAALRRSDRRRRAAEGVSR